jgi:hypothetical protein
MPTKKKAIFRGPFRRFGLGEGKQALLTAGLSGDYPL